MNEMLSTTGKTPVLEAWLAYGPRCVGLLYTALMRRRFRRWGKGSRVSPPLRVSCPWAIDIGEDVAIDEHCVLNVKDFRTDGRASLMIGDGTRIGRFVHINAWYDVVIESQVLITHRVILGDETHNFGNPDRSILAQGGAFGGAVLLRSGCWIGTGAAILPGVVVGKNSVVGANAVVTHDVPDCAVVAGVPARVIRRSFCQ